MALLGQISPRLPSPLTLCSHPTRTTSQKRPGHPDLLVDSKNRFESSSLSSSSPFPEVSSPRCPPNMPLISGLSGCSWHHISSTSAIVGPWMSSPWMSVSRFLLTFIHLFNCIGYPCPLCQAGIEIPCLSFITLHSPLLITSAYANFIISIPYQHLHPLSQFQFHFSGRQLGSFPWVSHRHLKFKMFQTKPIILSTALK